MEPFWIRREYCCVIQTRLYKLCFCPDSKTVFKENLVDLYMLCPFICSATSSRVDTGVDDVHAAFQLFQKCLSVLSS